MVIIVNEKLFKFTYNLYFNKIYKLRVTIIIFNLLIFVTKHNLTFIAIKIRNDKKFYNINQRRPNFLELINKDFN